MSDPNAQHLGDPSAPSGEPEDTVLIVDDDLDILRILRKRLAKSYRVVEAHDGEEAIRIAAEERPDCIVLDVMMPGRSGWEVAKLLRGYAEFEHTGILMLTAIGETVNEMASPLYGANAQLDKPFDLDQVARTVAGLIAQGRADRARARAVRR